MNDDPGVLPAGAGWSASSRQARPDTGPYQLTRGALAPVLGSLPLPPGLEAGAGPEARADADARADAGARQDTGAGAHTDTSAAATSAAADASGPPRKILIVAWRDLANQRAGGSEVLVDRLASGMLARGHDVTLLCGGMVAERPYRVVRNGGTYSQFLRAPLAYLRNFRDCDLIVEVCNGMPFLGPLWCRRPVLCLVNHVHAELWPIRFRPPISTVGRAVETRVMPWVHRQNLFLTVSASTAEALQGMGVHAERIRQICNGVEQPDPLTPRSPEPLFLALGRLTDYKRLDLLLRLWDRVRHVTGGQLLIAGDGPERARLEALAGPGVVFAGRVTEQEKHRLLCAAWLLVHPALIEGWGIVVAEAAIRGTPAVAFDVPGLRDSVLPGRTGMLTRTEGEFASAWASLAIDARRREALGQAARTRATRLHWPAAVDGFARVAEEAITRLSIPGGSGRHAGDNTVTRYSVTG